MTDFPAPLAPVNHVEPVPRRIRAFAGGRLVLDTTDARYVFENPYVPQFYIPLGDVNSDLLHRTGEHSTTERGVVEGCSLVVDGEQRPGAARLYLDDGVPGLQNTLRFDWQALDSWFEEDEEVFVHPRNPYTRVDAVRSSRTVRVEVDGTVLAESGAPVMVFETGLPVRYYLERTGVDFTHLRANDTRTQCPYKGRTSGGWDATVGESTIPNIAWAYDFPTAALTAIKGMICFYNEKVDIVVEAPGATRRRPGHSGHIGR